jgi:peptidoglycan/xylan/chitin deacetylase (PgdA/CDA1 family)
MYFVRTPYIIKKLFSQFVWDLPNAENMIYLTFDDGPHPEITPWILEQLKKCDAKATFFCLGKNAEKYPEIINQYTE